MQTSQISNISVPVDFVQPLFPLRYVSILYREVLCCNWETLNYAPFYSSTTLNSKTQPKAVYASRGHIMWNHIVSSDDIEEYRLLSITNLTSKTKPFKSDTLNFQKSTRIIKFDPSISQTSTVACFHQLMPWPWQIFLTEGLGLGRAINRILGKTTSSLTFLTLILEKLKRYDQFIMDKD